MTNEVTTTAGTELQTFGDTAAWGAGEVVDNQDILIPKINLQQPLSELVQDERARPGDFCENVNGGLLGRELEFLSFGSFKTLQVWVDGKWAETKSWDPEFRSLPYEQIIDGKVIKNIQVLNYYVLLLSELDEGTAFPYVLPFKSTGMRAGKKLATSFAKLKMFNAPSAAKVFKLTASLQENDKGKFWVPDVVEVRNSIQKEVAAAKQWFDAVNAANVQVREDE